jgi:hypothetical protein
MVEIAISLAVIGFALVAIIGILPSGMEVQKENRHETIIVQDQSMLMNAIRGGARGLDDLTNYVFAITNYQWTYNITSTATNPISYSPVGYTSTTPPEFPLTNGFRIVGLLSTPRFSIAPKGYTYSNYVVAFVRSMSGPAFEKFPQQDATVQELGLRYRLICEVVPYAYYDPDWINYTAYTNVANPGDWQRRSNYWAIARTLRTNLYDVRLTFRWPLLPDGSGGGGRQTFRTLVSGHLLGPTNEVGLQAPPYSLYFFEPRDYVKAQ